MPPASKEAKEKAKAQARTDAAADLSRLEPGVRHRDYSDNKEIPSEIAKVMQEAYDAALGVGGGSG